MALVLDLRPCVVVAVPAVALCAAVAASSPAATAACNGFALTPGQIGGAHFKASPVRHSVVGFGIRGTPITLSGYVLASGCRPVRGARVDFWQADENGVYDDKGFKLRSHQFTNDRGRYWLQTILPGPYANRTRHLHVTVRAPGERPVTTMLYFPGVALNAHDPFIDRRLIVRLRIAKHRFLARFDFVLEGR
ncbi:MAG: intradiol ring-cleavage dioxygenase [Actinomycetota bacterium]|nr:intradiol ring-cleavage dioxygenase [Actinomycetota bacterium]